MSGLRIADVARRSGFTPATLRYYEEIGLLPRPARTAGGYRSYGDDALARLAFIARAKQLGCTLDEISDLSIAWDGGRCGPIQDRLRELVAAKLEDAQARITELVMLSAELQQAGSALERHRPEGRCDEDCGCLSSPATTVASVSLVAKPDVPIACTLSGDAMPGRMEDWQRVLRFVRDRGPVAGGVRLELDPSVPLDDVVRLVAAEQKCCRFFSFAVTVDERGIGLEVRAPDDALPVVHALFGAAA
jgi:MerR family transcriptional regulator, copper efflux regulator